MATERSTGGRSDGFPDVFDLALATLHDLPDVTKTGQANVQSITPLVGNAETFIVQTMRQADVGDTIFLQVIGRARSFRLVLPPKVSAVLARQRDSLGTMNRRKGARKAVETRAAKGIVPAFLKKRGKRGKGRKS